MFSITVQNVTGTKRDSFTADSLGAAKRRASEVLRNGIIHYSHAIVTSHDSETTHTGSVSVGGGRVIWQRRNYGAV